MNLVFPVSLLNRFNLSCKSPFISTNKHPVLVLCIYLFLSVIFYFKFYIFLTNVCKEFVWWDGKHELKHWINIDILSCSLTSQSPEDKVGWAFGAGLVQARPEPWRHHLAVVASSKTSSIPTSMTRWNHTTVFHLNSWKLVSTIISQTMMMIMLKYLSFSVSDFTESLAQLYEKHAEELQLLVTSYRKKNGELRKEVKTRVFFLQFNHRTLYKYQYLIQFPL